MFKEYPSIDPTIAQQIESLGKMRCNEDFALQHELLGYGVSAVIHKVVIDALKPVSEGRAPLSKVVHMFGISFDKRGGYAGIEVNLKDISNISIYLPIRECILFFSDYLNRFKPEYNPEKSEEQYNRARQLCLQEWRPDMLTNPKVISEGETFARDMWQGAVRGFWKYSQQFHQPQHLTDLGEELIKYYESSLPELK